MRLYRYILIAFFCLFLTATVGAFDREILHSQRLEQPQRLPFTATDGATLANLATADGDLLVSESVAPATFTQDNAALVALAEGDWLAAWSDCRRGRKSIFWQRLDSLGAIAGSNELISITGSGADFVDPELAVDAVGRIYLFYRDRTNGLIFGSRYNADLTVDLGPFLVNDTSFSSFAGPFDFAVYPDGKMVAVWESYSALGSTIAMRLYDSDGNVTVNGVTVNSDGGSFSHWVPAVAVDPTGDILVCWEDYRNGVADVIARLFNGAGVPLGGDFQLVPSPQSDAAQFAPDIAYSANDDFIIGWIDQRADQEVYLQRYSSGSGLIGSNLLISGPDTQMTNWNLHLTCSPDDRLLANWAAFGPENSILTLRFNAGPTPIGTPTAANSSSVGRRWEPAAFYNRHDRYLVGWTEFADDNADIHLMLFADDGTALLGEEVKANDDAIGAESLDPFVVATSNWYNLVLFVDQRNDAGDIYCQTVANNGTTFGGNVRVNQDAGNNLQAQPSAAVSIAREKALVVWVDSRQIGGIPGQRIFGRFGTHWGTFGESEFMISNGLLTAVKSGPMAALAADGSGLVAWLDNRLGSPQLYGRWLTTEGNLDGDEFMISSEIADISNSDLHLGMDSFGRYYVVWLDKGLSSPTVKAKWYAADHSLGGEFSWASTVEEVEIDDIAAGITTDGAISILWTSTGAATTLYLTQLTNDGSVLAPPFEVTDNVNAFPSDPALSVSNNNYHSAAWVDARDGARRIYYQLFDNGLSGLGANQPVSTETLATMFSPATSANAGRAWFAWVDPRADGHNIWAATDLYEPTDVGDDDRPILPAAFDLAQNYPNPFNPSTEIRFNLPSQARVTLTVYNLLGRRVSQLVDDLLPAGEHTVSWDGTSDTGDRVASGLYLYRLEAGDFAASKKMVLLK